MNLYQIFLILIENLRLKIEALITDSLLILFNPVTYQEIY